MKKTAILFFSLASAVAVNAQGVPQVEPTLEPQDAPAKIGGTIKASTEAGAANVIWSEDFANGIPTGWTQNGTPATALWEYRGPNTTPDNTTGSRGAFSGITNNPPTNNPILSPTAANGFMIFDSDYLDNAGLSNNFGNGTAPAPHVGRLTTDTIDLSMHPQVELKFHMYARRFFSDWKVAISNDGGVTFTDTVEFYDDAAIPVNSATDIDAVAIANISAAAGGQANVVLQFLFDGTPGNVNGNGYYFWMLDDIEIRTPPANQMFFTAWNGAPPHDMIYNGNGAAYPKYGIMHSNQIVPVEFDANFFNYGTQTQTNATLEVEIWDVTSGSPSLVTTVSAPGCATLASGDTCDFNDLTTPQWTPPAQEASYLLVYKAVSDSISSAATTETDTFSFFVNDDLYSTDRNQIDNFVGTNSATSDIIAMGVMFDLKNEDPNNAGSGLVYIDGLNINLSALTDSTADIIVNFYDTTGFAYNAGFPAGTTPIFQKAFTLDGSMPGTNAFFDLTTNGNPQALPTGTYLMILDFFVNATDGVIRIANDASFDQPGFSTVMQLGDGNWYSGFTSQAHEGTHIRLNLAQYVGLDEEEISSFKIYPNPVSQNGNVEFVNGGSYAITVLDMVGNAVYELETSVSANERVNIDFGNLPAGVYLVNVVGEGSDETMKVIVQ